MFGRLGQDVVSDPARQHALSARGPGGGQALELSARRKDAIKKAFKRLDPQGWGFVVLDKAMQTLAESSNDEQQQVFKDLSSLASTNAEGKRVISSTAFSSYYRNERFASASDRQFEQLLQRQWGCMDVSDILAAMQRHFALAGFQQAFLDAREVSLEEFEASLQRGGLQPRRDDFMRVWQAFASPGGVLKVEDLRDQIAAPRPETPLSRDLMSPVETSSTQLAWQTPSNTSSAQPVPHPGQTPLHPGPPIWSQPATLPLCGNNDLDNTLRQMEQELQQLRKNKSEAPASLPSGSPPGSQVQNPQAAPLAGGSGPQDGPICNTDLDSALARLEARLDHVKHHTPVAKQHSSPPQTAAPPIDMPHWEHHKYGHHKITAPAWKPDEKITDMYGDQHNADEYHYSNYGAGSHGHHVAHFHLNDYHGLAHHSFKKEEYHRKQYGDAAHHGHWVPHLHGIGTKSHHGGHAYGREEYDQETHGKPGHHSHWVPHLHGIGETHPGTGPP